MLEVRYLRKSLSLTREADKLFGLRNWELGGKREVENEKEEEKVLVPYGLHDA